MKKTTTQFIRKQVLFGLVMVLSLLVAKAQVSVTATSGTTGPTSYTTVNAAFAAINAGTHQGAITISVTANTTETAPATQLLSSGTGSSSYTSVLIVPQGNVTINSAATPSTSRGVLEFIGADYITINGDDPLTPGDKNLTIQVATTSNGGTACLRFSSSSATANGCTNVTVRNCNFIGGRSSSTSTTTSFCIFSGVSSAGSNISTASGAANNDSMLIENNTFTKAYYGIYCYGLSGYEHDYLRIRNNTIGSSSSALNNINFRGIYTAYTQQTASVNSLLIEGNDVQGGEQTSGISTNIAGIDLNVGNAGAIIRNNNIHDVKNPSTGGWGSYGISISSSTSNAGISIYNNFIRDITAYHYTSSSTDYTNYGIYITAAPTGLRILHNTIALNQLNAGSGIYNFSACVYIANSSASISEMRNNIFVNNQSDNTGQACLNVYVASAGLMSNAVAINRNNYYVSGVSGYVGSISGTNYQSLNAWKTATTKDTNSVNIAPSFVSATDLHIATAFGSSLESGGDLTWITTDIDGQTRPGPVGSVNGGGTAPDIGADEADMLPPTAPVMATGSASNITTSLATLSASVIANGGATITATGIVLGTSPNPTRGSGGVIDSTTNPLVSSGSFSLNITGLTNGTTYYYRSYGVNAIGTSYGPDSTFTTNASAVVPTVSKVPASAVSAYTATAGGNILLDGGAPVIASGIVYGTSPNPTIGAPGVIDSTTTPVVTAGSFTRNLGGMSHSTKYYFRAYATNAVGTGYSVMDSFVTEPVISTLPYAENFDGATTPWAASAINGRTNSWVRGTPAKTFINGAFSAPNAFVTTLTGTYAGTEDCVVLSPQMDFSAQANNPVLRFKHKMDVDNDLNYDGGVVEISINGGAWTRLDPIAGTGGNFNTANSTAWYNNTSTLGSLGTPKWSVNTGTSYSSQVNGWITSTTPLTGAAGQSNVRFRFRFWADGGVDEGWAIDDIEVFTPTTPIVATGTKANVTTSAANLSGNISYNGGAAVTASGIVFSTTPNPTRGTPGVIDSATNPLATSGSFTLLTTGLSSGTTYYYRAYAVNALGTGYGADSTFTTNASATTPSVSHSAATNILAFSASVSANIINDGGAAITASGIVYGTSPNPTIGAPGVVDSTTNPLVTSGSFSMILGGLTHSTKYYFREYATNAVGTAYGVLDSFTTAFGITALPYSENFDGATTPWTTAAINGGTSSWTRGTPAKTFINGAYSAPNAFVTNLTGNYAGTEDCVVLSPQMDFSSQATTPVLRFKHKMDVDNDINYDGGVLEISIDGGAWTRLDPVIGTGGNFNTANSTAWYNNSSTNGTLGTPKWSVNTGASYSSQVNGWISSNTPLTGAAGHTVRVRFRFWADTFVDEGWAIDDIEVFVPTQPIVVTGVKSNITTSNATVRGTITSNGGSNVTASGIVFSTSPNPTRGTPGVVDSTTNPLAMLGNFNINLTGLATATTYYYRAYAENALGVSYGADSTFTTNAAAVAPTVVTLATSNFTTTSAIFGGNITSDGGAAVTASGVVYSSSNNLPSVGGVGVIDSTTTPLVALGTFSLYPTGLTHSTKYYFRAYATNSAGTAYGALDSFTTYPIVSSFPYTENFDGATTPWTTGIESPGGSNSWTRGTPAKTFINGAYSAPNAFVTNLVGNYNGTENCVLVSPQFDFSALASDPVLRFRNKMDVDNDINYDGGVVEISINGGAWTRIDAVQGTGGNFNTAYSYSWYNNASANGNFGPNKFSTNTGTDYSSQVSGWVESATRLVGAAGQSNVRVRFRFWADAIGIDEGWAIDNIEVVNVVTPTVAASNVSATPAATSANITFSPGNGAGRLVVARLASVPAVAPYDSVLYAADAVFGLGSTTGAGNYVVYAGTGTSVNVTSLVASTAYAFDVYEYNGRYMHNRFTAAANGTTTTTPVKLISFAGVKADNDAQLTWVTASERNNKGFFVERSTDGARYEAIGFVAGKGNSNNKVNYTFTDVNVFAGNEKVYYRLQQVDENGKTTYSGVVFITSDELLTTEVSAYPNPFSSELSVQIAAKQDEPVQLTLFDLSGRLVNKQSKMMTKGINTVVLEDFGIIPSGAYLLQVQTKEGSRFVKVFRK